MKNDQMVSVSVLYGLFVFLAIFAILPIGSSSENSSVFMNSFKDTYGSNWIIKWNEVTDTPHSILGSSYDLGVGTIDDEKKAEITATNFLLDNSDMFKIDNNIKLLSAEEGNDEWYVEYQQYYQDLIVFNGKAFITLTKKGELISAGSDIYSNVYKVTPSLTKEEAIKIAKENFNSDSTAEVRYASLIIYPGDDKKYYTVWDIQLFSNYPLEGKEFFIDSASGEIISEKSLIVSNEEKNESHIDNNSSGNRNGQKTLLLGLGIIIILLVLLIVYRYNKYKPRENKK